MKKKNVVSIATMVSIASLLMAGCGSSSTDTASTAGTADQSSQETVSSDSSASTASTEATVDTGDKTVIQFWHSWSGSEADALQAVIDDFNNSQDKIYVEALDSQTDDKMLTAIPSGDGPDLIYTADTTCSLWAKNGLLAPIDDYITSSGMDTSNIYESEYALGTYNGTQYGIPFTMDSYRLFYNKTVLDELNLEPPTTMEELADLCKKVPSVS